MTLILLLLLCSPGPLIILLLTLLLIIPSMISSRSPLTLARIPSEGESPGPLCGLFFDLRARRILPSALTG